MKSDEERTTILMPKKLRADAKRLGINFSQIARIAVSDAIEKMERKNGATAAKQNAPTTRECEPECLLMVR